MSSGNDAYLIVDDTNPGLIYSNNDWFDNVVADAFNQTLSSTTTNGATVQLQFEAAEITVLGSTVLKSGASNNAGPLTSYILDGSRNSATVFQADVSNANDVVFFSSSNLGSGKHTLEISVLSITDGIPFLLDAIALRSPQLATSTSTNIWVTTVFATPSSAASAAPNTGAVTTNSNSLPVGAIVGGVVGGVALLVSAALAFYIFYWRRRQNNYGYNTFSGAALFDAEEKDRGPRGPQSLNNDPRASQFQPFLASNASTRPYSDYYPTSLASTPGARYSIVPQAGYDIPPTAIAGAAAAYNLPPHTYPPPPESVYSDTTVSSATTSSLSSSTRRSSSRAALSVVNEAAVGTAALTPAQLKAQEAFRSSTPDTKSLGAFEASTSDAKAAETKDEGLKPETASMSAASSSSAARPAVKFHRDSGVRFDAEGRPVEADGSGSREDHAPLVDVPPEYTEL